MHISQDDPRKYRHDNILLLQINSDFNQDIMWGDVGLGNFFIRKEDLKQLNFSNVLYNWDCG